MIGIFDSGSGGLTVLKAIRSLAPNVDIVYVADLANMPYGDLDTMRLRHLTFDMLAVLRQRGADTLVSACNSISASVIRPMFDMLGVQNSDIIEMVGPTVKALRDQAAQKIVVLATPATNASGLYQRAGQEQGLDISVISVPRLAALIENNADLSVIQKEVDEAVEQALAIQPDTMVLGCTHYPLAQDAFQRALDAHQSSAKLFDPSVAVAARAIELHGTEGTSKVTFLVTKQMMTFKERANAIGGTSIHIEEIPEFSL